jgi:hypothetical protein
MSAADVQQLVDEWRTRKVNAMLAMIGGLLQPKGQPPNLVQEGIPQEAEETPTNVPDLAAA